MSGQENPNQMAGKEARPTVAQPPAAADSKGADVIAIAVKETGNGFLEIRVPYNEAFISDIKYEIPREARSWDAKKRAWIVDSVFRGVVEKLLREHFVTYRGYLFALNCKNCAYYDYGHKGKGYCKLMDWYGSWRHPVTIDTVCEKKGFKLKYEVSKA